MDKFYEGYMRFHQEQFLSNRASGRFTYLWNEDRGYDRMKREIRNAKRIGNRCETCARQTPHSNGFLACAARDTYIPVGCFGCPLYTKIKETTK